MPNESTESDRVLEPSPSGTIEFDPRCLHCGYIVRGVRDSTCPECGRRIYWSRVVPDILPAQMREELRCRRNQLATTIPLIAAALGFIIWRMGSVSAAVPCVFFLLAVSTAIVGRRVLNNDDWVDSMWLLAGLAVLLAIFIALTTW